MKLNLFYCQVTNDITNTKSLKWDLNGKGNVTANFKDFNHGKWF